MARIFLSSQPKSHPAYWPSLDVSVDIVDREVTGQVRDVVHDVMNPELTRCVLILAFVSWEVKSREWRVIDVASLGARASLTGRAKDDR